MALASAGRLAFQVSRTAWYGITRLNSGTKYHQTIDAAVNDMKVVPKRRALPFARTRNTGQTGMTTARKESGGTD